VAILNFSKLIGLGSETIEAYNMYRPWFSSNWGLYLFAKIK